MSEKLAEDSQQVIDDLQRRLDESIAQQAATADVLRAISRSKFDLQTVLETLITSAVKLCGANRGSIFLREGDAFPLKAASSTTPEFLQYWAANPPRAGRGSATSRVIASGKVEVIVDVLADPEMQMPTSSLNRIRGTLGVPMLRNNKVEGVMVLTRPEPGPFSKSQIDLVQTFADQAMIAIENARLFDEVQAKSADLREALQHQTAASEVLQVISRSPGELDPVFQTILSRASGICEAQFGLLLLFEGGGFRCTSTFNLPPAFAETFLRNPVIYPPPIDPLGRLIETRQLVHVIDVKQEPAFLTGFPPIIELVELGGARTLLLVPMLKENELIGVIAIFRQTVHAFTDKQIELVTSFGSQAVIAIENARLLNETRESLERQTATSDILKVIASSPNDVQPVFESIVKSAATLFAPCSATITMLKEGQLHWNASAELVETFDHERARAMYPIPFDPKRSPSTKALLERRIVEIPDISVPETPEFTRRIGMTGGFRSITFVPLVSQDVGIGTIILTHPTAGFKLSQRQLDLVQTFADQAVIAIENVRLFDEVQAKSADLHESLQHQTALSEVLKVISRSPGQLDPVFQTILTSATDICGAEFGNLFVLQEDRGFHCASTINLPPAFAETFLRQPVIYPPPIDPLGRVIATRQPVHIVDAKQEPAYVTGFRPFVEVVELGGAKTILLVPMLKEDVLVGVIAIFRQTLHPFSGKQIELVTSFANQAVIAIQNTRLFNETREALEQQTAIAEVLGVINASPGNLTPVFEAMVEKARRLCDADSGHLALPSGDDFRTAVVSAMSPELEGMIRAVSYAPGRGTAIGRSLLERRAVQIADIAADSEHSARHAAHKSLIRTILGAPLLREGEPIGAFGLSRARVEPFTQRQIDLVETFASQAVIAIENARLLDELRQRTKELSLSLEELRTAQDRLVQTEKLASLGQLTAGIAHEIKNPLNFVNNFSALSADLIDELNDLLTPEKVGAEVRTELDELTQMLKGNLEKVVQHGKRADSIVKNMLLHSREGSGERRSADINAIVEESLNLAYHGARAEKSGFNITLQRGLDPAAGMVDLYPQEITRVLLNLISNGFYAASKRKEAGEDGFEPSLMATTKNLDNGVEIRIRDNGTGIPAEVKEKMFNPFFTTKPAGEGTGLGLSMSHDIVVKQHGGKIEVDTAPGQFTEFIITLPRAAARGQAGG